MKDNTNLSKEQKAQERIYSFPYHYIPVWTGWYFSQVKVMNWGYRYIAYINHLLDMLVEEEFEKLLDVGCGDGRFLFELSKKVPPEKLAGIDYSERATNFASAFLPSGVKIECGDIAKEVFSAEKFDVITLIETLEHISPEEIPVFLKAIRAKLSENGKFILTVPSENLFVSLKHFQHFTEEKLREYLEPFFRITKVRFLCKKQGMFMGFLQKLMTNKLFVINNDFISRNIYRYYCKYHLNAEKHNCMQILVVCKKK